MALLRISIPLLFLLVSCSVNEADFSATSCRYARFFDLQDSSAVIISPYDASRDTIAISEQDNFICMSTSYAAALSMLGSQDCISAVSGIRYISDPVIKDRYSSGHISDVGYESLLDYESIMKIKPDMMFTYTVSGAVPPYISKLKSAGIPVTILYDHLESHPLARAEYIRLFGRLTGKREYADSLYKLTADRYEMIAGQDECRREKPVKVLLNIPYGDSWYIPGAESYMSRLIADAGGIVLGAEKGTSSSRTISMEEAYILSQQADVWLNPGNCRTRRELMSVHQLFPEFGPLAEGRPIYNNTLRITPEGGNDFWESGSMRPDLILEDLTAIFNGKDIDSLNYFISLD